MLKENSQTKKIHRITIRLSGPERVELEKLAYNKNKTLSEYLRYKALKKEKIDKNREIAHIELEKLVSKLKQLADNLKV